MILFLILMFIAFSIYYRHNMVKDYFIIFLLCLIVYIFFLFEYSFGFIDYLISDSYDYYHDAEKWMKDKRFLWGYINYFVKEYDFLGDIFIKIINIPILMILLFYLKNIFNVIKNPYIFLIFCPFLLMLSISNLRDLLIMLFAVLAINFYNDSFKYYFHIVLFSICVFRLTTSIIK